MTTTTTTIAVRGSYALRMLGALLKAGLLVCRTRRENRSAIAHLGSMSDAQLRDIGIERDSIEMAVICGHRSDMHARLDIV